METMGNFSESLIIEESRLKNKHNEAFEITSIDITPANKLDGVIKNTGQIPVKLTTLWIDEQGVNDVVQKFTLDTAIAPGNTVNIIDMADYTMDPTKGYNMKVVTSRGEVNSFYVNSASQESLDIQLMAIPETITSGFATTLLMTVVNNMSNNNVLVNLTPSSMSCGTGCTLVSGPTPASYDSLDKGEVAIFQWTYELTGDEDDTFSFTGSLQNGVPGNSDSETVTIKVVLLAGISGESVTSLGLGNKGFASDVIMMHTETWGTPSAADYQLSLQMPDTSGTTVPFDVGIKKEFFLSNVTGVDVNFPAGNWNASLRYNSARLPDGMNSNANDIYSSTANGGHTFHFNNLQTSNIEDSGQDSTCYNKVSSGSAGIFGSLTSASNWHSNQGVNASGAHYFDGTGDSIRIDNTNLQEGECTYIMNNDFTIAGWFNATDRDSYHTKQVILYSKEASDKNGVEIFIGDGTAGNHGMFSFIVTNADTNTSDCISDPGGDGYMDNNWHHFVGTGSGDKCHLYIDGVDIMGDTMGDKEIVNKDKDVWIGANDGGNDEFQGMIDDIMWWNTYSFAQADVDALFGASFGSNAHEMTFVFNKAHNTGVTASNLVTSANYELPYVDQMRHTDVDDLWAGFNYTASLPAVTLSIATQQRINFTMSFDSGLDLNLRLDDTSIDGSSSTLLSSYLQLPNPPEDIPSYATHDQDDKIDFFITNNGIDGIWLTNQGTRIVFNGTNGNYAGLIDTVEDSAPTIKTLSATQDSPFIDSGENAEVIFWHAQESPAKSQPGAPERIPPGNYVVTIFLSGYSEDGDIFVRSMNMGTVQVVS
jgi:hypothetical protein